MYSFYINIFIFFLLSISLNAAAPVTHVYFAQIWIDNFHIQYSHYQKEFIAGTLFPDIRYLGTISRNATHERGVTPEKIRATHCIFEAGMRLHSLVDEVREKYVHQSGVMEHLHLIPKNVRVLFLKLLEDEILWNYVHSQEVLEALYIDYPQEVDAGVERQTAQKWHKELITYFSQRPSEFLKLRAARGKGFLNANHATVIEWTSLLPHYAANPRYIKYTEEMVACVCTGWLK
jgi:hypothetical protein